MIALRGSYLDRISDKRRNKRRREEARGYRHARNGDRVKTSGKDAFYQSAERLDRMAAYAAAAERGEPIFPMSQEGQR